ncbi:Polyribonucleotide nucleotidyltransferase, partial [Bienertia sinuspersici]
MSREEILKTVDNGGAIFLRGGVFCGSTDALRQSMRHLTQFVSSIEEIVRETSGYHRRVVPRFRPVPLLA